MVIYDYIEVYNRWLAPFLVNGAVDAEKLSESGRSESILKLFKWHEYGKILKDIRSQEEAIKKP